MSISGCWYTEILSPGGSYFFFLSQKLVHIMKVMNFSGAKTTYFKIKLTVFLHYFNIKNKTGYNM